MQMLNSVYVNIILAKALNFHTTHKVGIFIFFSSLQNDYNDHYKMIIIWYHFANVIQFLYKGTPMKFYNSAMFMEDFTIVIQLRL